MSIVDAIPESFSNENLEHVVLYGVSWESYEHLLELFGDRRLSHTYDNGTLEIMSPLKRHDWLKKIVARMFEAACDALEIDTQSIGSTTLRKKAVECGLEPDESYYIQHEADVRGKDHYDADRDPPPDLAIESEETHLVLDRLGVYSQLQIPELWRVSQKSVKFYKLQRKKYVEITHSVAVPAIEARVIQKLLAKRHTVKERLIVREFVDLVLKKKP